MTSTSSIHLTRKWCASPTQVSTIEFDLGALDGVAIGRRLDGCFLLLADDQQPFLNFARENGFTVPKVHLTLFFLDGPVIYFGHAFNFLLLLHYIAGEVFFLLSLSTRASKLLLWRSSLKLRIRN
jgi:hypothetical protein